ncbi:hypothetical protein COY65_00765 [Candidatus Jorgensenbacteria bacterium CG_4_10_14_0_8_um_filter_39_13]|uniref:YkuD domain-containing protein n=2 Tax=Candidatus Joergenseniibacteriota TaxID=1752739 RepID=A0A2M7RI83_9BACT|nr:MAG: hypothetical protein COS46_00635 [Candidatus Jorgensenbacteria bacterium CG03_land_8_20_14_0_80_38_39]PIW97369.1 MAG: hypothetical protein COZ81_02940 [Candidatus Jorgensenbacteria bacterium CG_4_8_14_3_um_filter_38_10]PIY96414.1 MAG: hypothetical protein COY65_00765 [Candidatus Jorgensenbacteria bacterium CG_4_10_14_0_8_um_filter_39_13]PJA95067.1 MAG: hypothetical protein CO130_01175 [Candidatus Jorgensenbacteria bacterium CG_4_9_14_3_um_filter_38_10]
MNPGISLVAAFLVLGSVKTETDKIKEEFRQIVGDKTGIDSMIDVNYRSHMFQDAIQRLKEVKATEDQYFVYVDRNFKKQFIFVCFFDSKNKKAIEIGRDRVSTGKPDKGKDYFLTPIGIFKNSLDNFSYRALGIKNSRGWRGLGRKGSRVWDFGWQRTEKIIKGKKQEFLIRLLMHATDPNFGEPRLGNVDSKGCVRISAKLNNFLDRFGLLDKEYEENNSHKNVLWLLRKDREPVKQQGVYLIVGDSSGW